MKKKSQGSGSPIKKDGLPTYYHEKDIFKKRFYNFEINCFKQYWYSRLYESNKLQLINLELFIKKMQRHYLSKKYKNVLEFILEFTCYNLDSMVHKVGKIDLINLIGDFFLLMEKIEKKPLKEIYKNETLLNNALLNIALSLY